MIAHRRIEAKIKDMMLKFPVITLTGTRQCGKSTVLKNCFPDYGYVSLEDPDVREFASSDPRGFLRQHGIHTIIDEAQCVPSLFSYIQTAVDFSGECGQYILSGSHNFLLMEGISQSLAGRCAVLKLAPFSLKELRDSNFLPAGLTELLLCGGYPRLYDKHITPSDYFPSYVATYIERDVRSIKRITDGSSFIRFVKLCAARSGQVLNIAELSSCAGISVPTAREWLSVLEQSYVLFRLNPYYDNFSKRLVKAPKLYFYDTGLLCYLLGIESEEQLAENRMRGSIFETFIINEYIKSRIFAGQEPGCFYWRDTNQNEIDLLTLQSGALDAYEIKMAETMNKDFTKTLIKFSDWANIPPARLHCIYTGTTARTNYGEFLNYADVWE